MHTTWRKSSYSTQEGGQCVEVACLGTSIGVRDSVDPGGAVIHMRRDVFVGLVRGIKSGSPAWRTSSHTGQEGGTCVELARLGGGIGVRDSVDPGGPVIRMRRDGLASLFRQIKTGDA